jgi:hypothetical protein
MPACSMQMSHCGGLLRNLCELLSHMLESATHCSLTQVFNLRDLSRVYEGLLLSTPDKFKSGESFLRLWRNEVQATRGRGGGIVQDRACV